MNDIIDNRKALLLKRLNSKILKEPYITKKESDIDIPLSYSQQRLWFIEKANLSYKSTYNVLYTFKVSGNLNIEALSKAFTEIVKRHEILRTNFIEKNGEPFQVVNDPFLVEIPVYNFIDKEDPLNEAIDFIIKEDKKKFNLQNDRLINIWVVKISNTEVILTIKMHHIICDGWSIGVLFKELQHYYNSILEKRFEPLLELPIQYADFSVWQRKNINKSIIEKQLDYWRKRFEGGNPTAGFPLKNITGKSINGNVKVFKLSKEITQNLVDISIKEKSTLFMTFFTVYLVLLSKYTDSYDLVVGTPIANRNKEQIKDLIGFFVNTLPIRTQFNKNMTLKELLSLVKTYLLEAYDNQDVPFERIVQKLNPDRDLSQSPLFKTMFVLQNASNGELLLNDVVIQELEIYNKSAKFEILISLTEVSDGVHGTIEYNTDLFSEKFIDQFICNYKNMLEKFIKNIDENINALNIKQEIKQQETENYKNYNLSFLQLFNKSVNNTPEKTAVVFKNETLSYKNLDIKSNILANLLKSKGVVKNVSVGVWLDRSINSIVSLLGIIKIGANYVPIDPTYPIERIKYIVENSDINIIITDRTDKGSLPFSGKFIYIDKIPPVENRIDEEFNFNYQPNDIAYTLFTSGTTGKPKGVQVPYKVIDNLINWESEYIGINQPNVIQLASIGFDVSILEILYPIANSGTIFILDNYERLDPNLILSCIAKNKIEVSFFSYSVFKTIVDHAKLNKIYPNSLKAVISTGESLIINENIKEFFQNINDCKLINQYGPTESHVVTSYKLPGNIEEWEIAPPIGKQIPNAKIYILNTELKEVPFGAKGEIYIGGETLAKGYLDSNMTKEKFIKIGDNPNNFLYKTGDIGYYDDDLNIRFVGRKDNQVKIRGHRIELNEIEINLLENEFVDDCVVLLSENRDNILAFIILKKESNYTSRDLQSYLKQKLPNYMIPNQIIFKDSFEKNSNGKVDRNKLKILSREISSFKEDFLPNTDTQKKISHIWSEMLENNCLNIKENFFAIGGHSLLVVQVISRIEKSFNVSLNIQEFFENPTIDELSNLVETKVKNKNEESTPILIRVEREDYIL